VSEPLDPTGSPLQIGDIVLRTPGLQGQVEVRDPGAAATRAEGLLGTRELAAALAQERVQPTRVIQITDTQEVDVGSTPTRSTTSGEPGIEVVLPHPGDSWGQFILHTDEAGVTTWHFARDLNNNVDTSRGGATQTFVIPRRVVPAAPESEVRGLISSAGMKLLTVLVFPLLDPLIGQVAEGFASKWEAKNRPYRIRTFTPENFASPPEAPSVQAPDWTALGKGRALVMIHGTFSQTHTGFAGLSPEFVTQLNQQYGGRVIAFDHYTLSETPTQNVQWFLQQMPNGTAIEADIVCHSRGGLVARVFTEKQDALNVTGRKLNVNRVVFVAAPNAGTVLTDMKYMNDYVDAYTNILNFFPDTGITDIFEAIITVAKQLAVGALGGLTGLESMLPGGKYLTDFLDVGSKGNTSYFALASNYQPSQLGLQLLHAKLAASIFKQDNDLIVPTAGVYQAPASGFPIDDRYVFGPPDEVQHSGYFATEKARQQIFDWLSAN
jgi:hypothetical protein